MHPFSSNPYPPAANMGSWPYQVGPGYQPGSSDPIHTANMDLWPQGPEYQPGSSEPSPYPPAANMDSWPYQVGPEYQPCNSDPVSSSLYPPAVNMDLSPQGRGDQAGGSGHATPMQDSNQTDASITNSYPNGMSFPCTSSLQEPALSVNPAAQLNDIERMQRAGLEDARNLVREALKETAALQATVPTMIAAAMTATPRPLPPLQHEYPSIRFWHEQTWCTLVATSKRHGRAAMTRSAEKVPLYLEEFDGITISLRKYDELRQFLRSVWADWRARRIAMPKYADCGAEALHYMYRMAYDHYPLLQACESQWKLRTLASVTYTDWVYCGGLCGGYDPGTGGSVTA